ncbi:uncharacterized protein LOC129788969 isoform X2 [Lutzomyia longipalpis]|uniref:uncharacterized protein LOC129788969 isoform X2 n=1 Tax=Lutzomyia longipalpis TaxID=7200 RepID=UPI00248345FF|nr:uncharacterized protein LOC129788969 isoform X2 [Lutzomyia longipalpis]
MMMTDCSSIQGSTSSSDITSSRGITPRVRVVRLTRPHTGARNGTLLATPGYASFGFAIRGGREFGTGFFVSRVEKGSEADHQGLRVGDQIIRANGYHVDDAVHRELSQFISSQDRLTLKVRGIGMIPVKEACDPLSWHIVPLKGAQVSPTELDDAGSRDIRVTLNVAPRSKLGLGICKGPEWKPGIFVQFTKEIGVARDAGLRPGDQLLSCNGIDFSDILFSEAVAIMKSSSRLDLVVRTAVGLDLFPGESSGYNSSASSVTGGDQSPCWGDQASKRLSMVREENGHIDNTLGSTRRPKSWERGSEADRRMEKLHPVAPPRIPEDHDKNTKGSNTTIIKLSDTGTVINNTVIPHLSAVEVSTRQTTRVHVSPEAGDDTGYENDEDSMDRSKVADICFVSRQSETKTVIVEVHRNPGGAPESPSGAIPPPPPPGHTRTPSVVSTSSGCPSSLSSAISDELKRRAVRMQSNPGESIEAKCEKVQSQARKIGNSIGGHDNDRHNALMSEFKRAHRKMFKNSEENGLSEDERHSQSNGTLSERKEPERMNGVTLLKDHPPPSPPKAPLVKMNSAPRIKPTTAPPPPPLPFADGAKNFSECRPPASPSPDYEDSSPAENHVATNGGSVRGTLSRVAASEMAKANGDMAEMESIESFKLTNPSSPPPRPPSHYFAPQSSGPPTMRKNRPVSVTIGEYGQVGRKEPAKFNFIARPDESPRNGNDEDMSQRLRNELEMTLSRSNLKKRSDIEMANGETTNGANGMATTVTINGDSKKENNCLENGKLILQKSISSNIEKTNGTANRVMITIPSKPELRKTESSPPSGILKNGGTTMAFTNGAPEHKNITFGNITTVIARDS